MPCPFTDSKMFWAGPNFLCHTKNLFTLCGSHKHFVQAKRWYEFSKIGFCAGTKVFEEAHNYWVGSKNLDRHKTFWDL